MGLFGLAAAFGPAVGPVIGGYLTDYVSWRAVFYVNLLPGLFCMGLVFLVLPNTRDAQRRSLDLLGLVTLAVFLRNFHTHPPSSLCYSRGTRTLAARLPPDAKPLPAVEALGREDTRLRR
jgi:MFS family permease